MPRGKKTHIGEGPKCPRCGHVSKLYKHSTNSKKRHWAHCENPACITKAFPPESKKVHSDRVRVPFDGPPCPRCKVPTVTWKHAEGWKPPKGKGYYEFWYQCMNEICDTQQIMPREAFHKWTPGGLHS
jgi:hypothetical protein